jgi:outer membrane protein insertion porin family
LTLKTPINFKSIGIFLLMGIYSCNIYKQIPDKSSILVSNHIELKGQEKDVINDLFYKDEIYKIPVQKPNKKIFGIPISQHIWAFYNKHKVTKFSQFMKTKVGKAPIIFDSTKLERSRVSLENYYFNIGYFDNQVKVGYQTKKKRTKVVYEVDLKIPYVLRNIYVDSITPIQKDIQKEFGMTLLEKNEILNIEKLEREIARMTLAGNDKGYFNFTKDYIKYRFDTFQKTHEVDVYVKILEETDSTFFRKYRLDNIYVFINSSKEQANINTSEIDTIGGVLYIQSKDKKYNERFIDKFIYKTHDTIYSKGDINKTIQRLSELNNFKLINSSYKSPDDTSKRLDVIYTLTPSPRSTISLEQSFYNSTLGFIGAQPTLKYINRNLTKKADKLSISLSGAVEFNAYLNQEKNFSGLISRTDLSILTSYAIEKFLLPNFLTNNKNYLFSRTFINSNYTYSKRLGFYDIHNIGTSIELQWARKKNTTFSYSPISFNAIIFPANSVSDEFKNTLNLNPFLKSSFNNSFIIGSLFWVNHLSPIGRRKFNSLNFRLNLETAGNTVYLVDKFVGLSKDESGVNIEGIDISQYLKSQFEVINSTKITQLSSLHSRLKFGVAFPFGNSLQLPYIKQYFIGGPYSLRAFQPRTIGAGNFNPNSNRLDSFPRDQTGNMMLEFNSEFRFHIVSFLKGALFIDGGNIWNSSINFSQDESGVFKLSEFYKQMYLGGGFGLRGDFNYFIMRFDIGIPLRVPYLTKNDWVITDAKPFNPDWFRNNLVINFAIGYPF